MKFKQWLKIRESMGFGPFLGKCKDTPDYQILGACSDQKKKPKRPKIPTFGDNN